MDCFPLLVRLSVWPVCGLHRTPWALWALTRSGPSHLEEQVVFEYPLHGDHQQVLQLELPVLDLQGAFLGVGGAASGFRASCSGLPDPSTPTSQPGEEGRQALNYTWVSSASPVRLPDTLPTPTVCRGQGACRPSQPQVCSGHLEVDSERPLAWDLPEMLRGASSR